MFSWIAIDSSDIYVMNKWYNLTELTGFSEYIEYPNPNPLFVQYTTSIVSFGGKTSFHVEFDRFLANSLIIRVMCYNPINTQLSIGVQIIVGTLSALKPIKSFQNQLVNNALYIDSVPIENYLIFQPIYKMYSAPNTKLKFKSTVSQDDQNYNYEFSNFGDPVVFCWVTIGMIIPTNESPIRLKKLRVSKQFSFDCLQHSFQQILEITELKLKETNSIDQIYMISKSISEINLIYTFECQLQQQISGYALQCPKCQQQNQIFKSYCYEGIDMIKFHFLFFPVGYVDTQINIKLDQKGMVITQDVGGQTYKILNLEVN